MLKMQMSPHFNVSLRCMQKYAEYYEVIKDPLDLRTVAKRIQSCVYGSLDEMTKDLLLIVQNARTFNEPGSQIYKVWQGANVRSMRLLLDAFLAFFDVVLIMWIAQKVAKSK